MPARKPLHLHAIDGTLRGDRHASRADPQTNAPASAQPPSHLSKDAAAAWRQIIAAAPRATLANADEIAIEVAANAIATYRRFAAAQARAALLQKNSDGDRTIGRVFREARAQAVLALQVLSQLGLTPIARTRIVAIETSDPLGDWQHGLNG